jgi:hypothetical protein
MKVIPPDQPLPFSTDHFVEMPGAPGHHYFTDVLVTVVEQRHCDVHIVQCPVTLIRDLSEKLENHGFDAFVRLKNPSEGEFWLRRRPEWPK